MAGALFSQLSDDVVLKILFKLEEDPRNWARLACSSTKFSSLIRNVCWKTKCSKVIPSVVSNLLSGSSAPPGGWAALHKLAVCCPGLLHSGVLFENSDFGLEREVGPDENYRRLDSSPAANPPTDPSSSQIGPNHEVGASGSNCSWSLFDDLYFDTVYVDSEAQVEAAEDQASVEKGGVRVGGEFSICKKRKVCRSMRSHLASGVWNLSREQGNKLLHSRFRGDCLYLCDWPGCVHIEEKRNYMLFRGIFKDFKGSQVWRTIKDGNRSKIDLNCAFCSCKETWDLHSAFCLRRVFGYHDDGEPVVRAYVCEMGMSQGLGLTCHCTLNGICLFSVRGGFLVLSFIIEVSLMSIGIEELREECVYFQCISVSGEHYVVAVIVVSFKPALFYCCYLCFNKKFVI
ncbi:phytochrome A-associated F-box protein [Prunus yedoensis var. nudiflora]|uniref:Phytochrome A-associated F-box protein n=1 Tax=Prunus yedoensis var. nudiflora TaxID=2094558 RepID=A0A314ZB00_PRUYE|nr:phytochrome A-associated F-box protein [Prunus yedoensis var. nudiflora]